jgi:uncharacterized membrane protein
MMAEQILSFLEHAGGAISLFGVLVIAGGFGLAAGRYAVGYRRLGPEKSFKQFKINLGRALILGLEILVVADVIETITVKPTLTSLASLAILVIVRTIVSWTLSLEVEGHWPWQTDAGG